MGAREHTAEVTPGVRVEGKDSTTKAKVPEEVLAREEDQATTDLLRVGCRLFHFRHRWTFNPWAHSIVSKGLGWKWLQSPPRPRTFFQEETLLLTE